jgi:PAS domain S-box-containing protein
MSAEKQKTILLVDDEAIIAMTEKMALEKYGYNVMIAPTGEDAVATVAKTPAIDLVLMDINLGAGIDGTETAAAILKERDLPVVFLSSHMEPEVVAKTEKITSYGYVVKNSSITVLDASIKMAFKLFEAKTKEIEKEKALKENEERLRDILFSMGDWVWEVDENGVYTYSSGKGLDLFGSSAKDIIGKTPFAFMPPDEAERVAALFAEIVADKTPIIDLENWNVGRNGERICLLTNGVPILDKEGNLKGYRGVDKDITGRKQTEKVLNDLIDKNPMSIQIMDKDGYTLIVNTAHSLLFGTPPPPNFSIFDDLQSKGFGEYILRAQKGEVVHFPNIYFNVHDVFAELQDKPVWIRAVLFPLTDSSGIIERFVFMHEDITARKQAEDALRENEEKFRILNTLAPAGIYLTDPEGNCLYTNPRWNEMAGFSSQEALGKGWVNALHPEDREIVFSSWKKIIESESDWGMEYRFQTPEGKVTWVYGAATPQRDALGKIIRFVGLNIDITERKFAESQREAALEALQESEEILRNVFVTIPDSVTVLELSGRITLCNQAAAAIHGFAETKQLIGKSFYELVAEEDHQRAEEGMKQTLMHGFAKEVPFIGLKAGGERFSGELSVSVIRDSSGRPKGFVGTTEDITERKRAEDALRESEEKWRKLVITIPDYISILDLEGRYTFLNHYAEGFSEKDVVGKNSVDFVSEDSKSKYRRYFAACKRTKQTQHCIYTAWGDNMTPKIYKGYFVPIIEKERIINIMAIATDITESIKIEKDLHESEERFHSIVENSTIGIYRTTPAGKILMANLTLVKMLGYSSFADLSGRNLEDDWFQPSYPRWQFIEKFTGQDEVIGQEAAWARRDGSTIFVREGARAVRNDQGAILYFDGTVEDITERKQAEDEVKRQLAEKEILLKEVHHRIKNNIASIGGLLSLHMQSVTNPEAVAVLQEAIGRVNSMRILYDKLLITEDYRDISVKNYIESLADAVLALFPDRAKIKLKKQIADFQLDPKQLFPLGLIINELITNKMKYAFIDREAGLITISLKNAAKHVTLDIRDNGNKLPAGFDMDKTKGFGLMLVKMLSQQLDGSFSIAKQAGTRCTVEFNM